MDLQALIFTACLIADPTTCKQVRMEVFVPKSMCQMQGQIPIAQWVGENPEWMVPHGYRCNDPRAANR